MSKLSSRQQEFMHHIIRGLVIKEAAYKMGVSHAEGKNLMFRARNKLGCRTSYQMLFILGREQAAGGSAAGSEK